MNDQQTRVADLKAAIAAFTHARGWEPFFSPKNLAMSIAIEAAELMEVFQWVDNAEARTLAGANPHRDRMADELADVMIYCLTLANALDLDVSTSIARKMEANGRKYPVEPPSPMTEQ